MKCDYDPMADPQRHLGMHHCPACGDMVVGGFQHPDSEALDRSLDRLHNIKFGDLVLTRDGYYGLVIDYLPPPLHTGETILLALANGTEQWVIWTNIEVLTLPGGASPANFQEWIHPRTSPSPARPGGSSAPTGPS